MDKDNQRNLIIAVALTIVLMLGWDAAMRHFYPEAARPKAPAAAPAAPAPEPSASAKPTREGGLSSSTDQAAEARDLQTALAAPGRVKISAPGLSGSINLAGAVIDDLVTNRHRATIAKDSPPERIFSPAGTPAQQFAQVGWAAAAGSAARLPDGQTVWTAPAGATLTPATPVTLSWTNGGGQTFSLTYAIDADYLITITQTVKNDGSAPFAAKPFALLNRTDKTASLDTWNVHSGPFGAFDGSVSFATKYKAVLEAGQIANPGKTDWVGFTDIYWMSALIPDKGAASSDFRSLGGGLYRADVLYGDAAVAPGQTQSLTTRLFAGAKESDVLNRYEAAGIPHFGLAIDWGWFRWFEFPIFWLLKALFGAVHNFGLAIILLTLIVKGIMFPVTQRQFASMAAMRAVQPKMKALQERYKDDKAKLQEETMALYKREGVNPLAGCVPMFLQIPVFFALYKTLMLAVEMRHQPFVGWIRDLSAPDPLHLLNLFGLLPFDPPGFLGIGVLALLLGITMWLQFKLNPQPTADPAQAQVFALMPWMMMFVMAPFAAGLLIYWITNNLSTIVQQKYLYARHPALAAQVSKDAADAKRAGKG